MTRSIKVPDWVGEAHLLPYQIPEERRVEAPACEDRVFWVSKKAAGIRVGSTSFAWSRDGLSRVLVYLTGPAKGPGALDLNLMWGDQVAPILYENRYDEASEVRFLELGPAIAEFLGLPFYVNGGADA